MENLLANNIIKVIKDESSSIETYIIKDILLSLDDTIKNSKDKELLFIKEIVLEDYIYYIHKIFFNCRLRKEWSKALKTEDGKKKLMQRVIEAIMYLIDIKFNIKEDGHIVNKPLFDSYTIEKDENDYIHKIVLKRILESKTNAFLYGIDSTDFYFMVELGDSKYAKRCFAQLLGRDDKKYIIIDYDVFKNFFDIPSSVETWRLSEHVYNPIIKKLGRKFIGLNFKTIKEGNNLTDAIAMKISYIMKTKDKKPHL